MKTKKIYNLYSLLIAMVAALLFLLPVEKIYYDLVMSLPYKIAYFGLNSLAVACLVLIIVFAVYNLITDDYEGVRFIKALSHLAFIFSFIVLFIFSASMFYSISYGYIIFSSLLFLIAGFENFKYIYFASISFKKYFKKRFFKHKEVKQDKPQAVLKNELQIKQYEKHIQNNKDDKKTGVEE